MNKFLPVVCLLLLFSFTRVNAQNFSTHQVKKGETIAEMVNSYICHDGVVCELHGWARVVETLD